MPYQIKRNREHFDVYINGQFYCSADSESEAESEVETYFEEKGDYNEIESA